MAKTNDDSLRCSLTELLSVFRDALVALIPTADRLLLGWRDGREHRDWERLTSTLFDTCVRGPVESDASRREGEFPLPPYDIDVLAYTGFSWIALAGGTTDPPRALVRLMTDVEPFDTVQFSVLDPITLSSVERGVMPFSEARFALRRRSPAQNDAEVSQIEAVD